MDMEDVDMGERGYNEEDWRDHHLYQTHGSGEFFVDPFFERVYESNQEDSYNDNTSVEEDESLVIDTDNSMDTLEEEEESIVSILEDADDISDIIDLTGFVEDVEEDNGEVIDLTMIDDLDEEQEEVEGEEKIEEEQLEEEVLEEAEVGEVKEDSLRYDDNDVISVLTQPDV